MSDPIDLMRLRQIAKKREQEGRKSLTEDERAYYQCMRALRPFFKKLSDRVRDPRFQEGSAAWEQMTPEEQEKYEDWTPEQLQAFLPLIEELSDEDEIVY